MHFQNNIYGVSETFWKVLFYLRISNNVLLIPVLSTGNLGESDCGALCTKATGRKNRENQFPTFFFNCYWWSTIIWALGWAPYLWSKVKWESSKCITISFKGKTVIFLSMPGEAAVNSGFTAWVLLLKG